jgi:phosphoglycerate dehydrogenase-like enzyme
MTAHERSSTLPRVVTDGPLDATILGLLQGRVELLPWTVASGGKLQPVEGLYTFGHPVVDGAMLDRLPGLRVIGNSGVGVDPIDPAAAWERSIAVGNTPGALEVARAERIAAAALDSTDPEPLPRGNLLLELNHVIITAHSGSATEQTRRRMAERSVTNLLAGLRGNPLPFAVRP